MRSDAAYGLIGAKLGHSYSAPIHRLLGDYRYELLEMSEAEVVDFFRARPFAGVNVTIPYKRLALSLCDWADERALAVGSVNTVVKDESGRLNGYNTDIGGFIEMLGRGGIELTARKVAILGSGGTSLTAQAVCRMLGAGETVVVSRSGAVDYGVLYARHADCQVIVNTTPVGMYPEVGRSPVDLGRFGRLEAVVDVIYNPARTKLMLDAEERGIRCVGGLSMLVAQAREASERFTGRQIDRKATEEITRLMHARMTNIVLVGMPGCGKTTLGARVARLLGRPFFDCDREIENRSGCTIPEIFEREGEAGFRARESGLLAELTKGSGAVIATGGGAVMNPGNRRLMRQNGRIAYVKRALGELATEGRPLSGSRDKLVEMQRLRAPVYRDCAEFVIENLGSVDEVAGQIARWGRTDDRAHACPVCGGYTLPMDSDYAICPVCRWEMDPVQRRDPDFAGGANKLSLNQARIEWRNKE